MPQHKENRVLPYTPAQLFDLVADIARYPEFLPWCKGARILDRAEDRVTADLMIGYKMFQEKFRSDVTLDRPRMITVRYLSGPLSHLTNQWEFKPIGNSECQVCFHVDFDFHSSLLRAAIEPFFER